jgi:hypothetical protein
MLISLMLILLTRPILNDLRETIPAGVFISYYAGRMMVVNRQISHQYVIHRSREIPNHLGG